MKRTTLAVLLLATTGAVGAADTTIEPGLYEITTRTDTGKADTVKQCMTPADVARGFQTSDLGKDCKTTRSVVAGGKLEFAQSCPGMTMTATGTYTPTTYTIDGKIQIKSDGENLSIETHGSGRRVGPCKS